MYLFLLAIQYISIFLLFIEAAYIFTKKRTTLQGYLFFGCIATLVNNAGYLAEMQATSMETYLVGVKLSYLGRAWIPFALLIFVIFTCKGKCGYFLKAFLGVIHSVTYFLVLTCERNNLYYTSYEYLEAEPFNYIKFAHGPWYKFYTGLIVIYIVYGIGHLTIALIKEKNPVAKKRLVWITGAIIIESASYIINIFDFFGAYDTTAMGYTLGTLFMYVAIFKYDLIDTMQLAKDYIIDEVSEAIIVINCESKVEFCNRQAITLWPGIEDSDPSKIAVLRDASKTNTPIEIGGRMYTPELNELFQDGLKTGEVVVLKDDTEHFNYLRELRRERDIAESANASKSRFLSVVSHEIRTPMNAIVGMSEVLLRDNENLTKKQSKYLNNIVNSGKSLVMIVNDILDQSKIEAGKMEIVEADYELKSLLEDVRLIIENRIGDKSIDLIMDVDEAIPEILHGDSLRIRQILINLLNNAVKFTETGFIRLSIRPEQQIDDLIRLRFSVSDSGQGIRPDDLEKLGQAFSQVDTGKNHMKEGTGLGLSISKDFIQLMGGRLEVRSEYTKGSEFFFSIVQGLAKETEDEAEEEELTFPEAKILVVDDTEINLMVAEEMLLPLLARVDTVSSGEKAIEMVEKDNYSLIFMDYMMPNMDGVETTKIIRAMGVKIPIYALSADASEETKTKFLEAGITGFTGKPLEIKKVREILANI